MHIRKYVYDYIYICMHTYFINIYVYMYENINEIIFLYVYE